MAKYLSAAAVRQAVEALSASSPRGRMMVFLVGLRTLTLSGTAVQAPVESNEHYAKALEELALWTSDRDEEHPYFSPFDPPGAGFKSPKYLSNGPGNTMHNWATQVDSPFEIDGTVRPKTIRRKPVTTAQLQRFLLIDDRGQPRKLRLIDVATWYFRRENVENEDGNAPTRAELEERFIERMGLTASDVAALFKREDADELAELTQGVGDA